MLARVGARGVNDAARQHDRGQRHVRAAVHHHLDVLREQLPVFGQPGPMTHARRVPLRGRRHVLDAIVDQLHRPAALQRQQGSVQGDRGRVFLLAAEAAAGGGLDDAHVPVVAAERMHQRLQHVVGALH